MALQDIISRFDITKPRTTQEAVSLNEATANPMPDEYELLRKQFTPEEIEILKNPDPNKPVLEQLYRKTVQKPKVISEKGMKAARTASHIGNSLSVLADMFGASQGAHIQRRNSGLVENQVANERAIRGQNEAETNQYNSGLLHAQYNDQQQATQERAQRRANMLSLIKMRRDEERQAAKTAIAYQQWLTKMGLDQTKENRRQFEADRNYKLAQQRVSISASKKSGAAKKNTSFKGIIINASPDDQDAETDFAGQKVKKIEMSPAEITSVARKAKQDPAFLKRNSTIVYKKQPNPLRQEPGELNSDSEIAWAYMQDMYDNSKQAPVQKQQPTVNTNILRQGGTSRAK